MGSPPRLAPRPGNASLGTRAARLAWPQGSCYEAHGIRLGVRSNDPRILASLPNLLPPGAQPTTSPFVHLAFSLWLKRETGVVTHDWRGFDPVHGRDRSVRQSDLPRALAALESAMRQGVAALAPDRVFVHAGVVGWRGRAILLPGRSRSGKSTLVAELVRAGASYLSDEFASLDVEGRVHPFTKPLTIRGEDGDDLAARRVLAEDLGGHDASEPLPVGLVALADYRSGASWQPAVLSQGHGVLEMFAHTVPARLRPEAALEALERATDGASILKGERGEAAETARRMLAALDAGRGLPLGRCSGGDAS